MHLPVCPPVLVRRTKGSDVNFKRCSFVLKTATIHPPVYIHVQKKSPSWRWSASSGAATYLLTLNLSRATCHSSMDLQEVCIPEYSIPECLANSRVDAPPPRVAPRVPPRSAAPPVNPPRPFGSEQRRERPRDPLAPTGASTRVPTQRPRGLSASSVMGGQEHEVRKDRERSDRPPRTESEERRRRERRKERDERHKREKEKIRTGGRTKKPQGLDIIDKLDVTGIYGQGREYNLHFQAAVLR
jgi:hypothetical protein